MKYHSQHLKKSVPNSFFRMDQESDRFRKCKNCGKEFMTPHRSRVYCNEFCSDEYNNREKRWKKEEASFMTHRIKGKAVENSELMSGIDEEILKNNVSILDSLFITQKDKYLNMELLDSLGFKFSHFSGQGKLFNIDPSNECSFLQFGSYRMYRVEFSTVLIVNLNYK